MPSDRYQGRFPGYTGRKLFEVEHPVFGRCTVAAPRRERGIAARGEVLAHVLGRAGVLRIREGNTRGAAGKARRWLSSW